MYYVYIRLNYKARLLIKYFLSCILVEENNKGTAIASQSMVNNYYFRM